MTKKLTAKDRAADLRLRRTFGITLSEYNAVLKHQGNRCAICRNPPKGVRLAVDHDHLTGAVRGLLCMLCNRALGKWRDNDFNVIAAAGYVQSYPATVALGRAHITAPGRVGTKKRAKLLQKMAQQEVGAG